MENYLSLAKAAKLAEYEAGDLALLCAAGRLDCRPVGEEWFVAEKNLIETLAELNHGVITGEIEDLRRERIKDRHLAVTTNTAARLRHAVAVILVILFGLLAFSSLASGLDGVENLANLLVSRP